MKKCRFALVGILMLLMLTMAGSITVSAAGYTGLYTTKKGNTFYLENGAVVKNRYAVKAGSKYYRVAADGTLKELPEVYGLAGLYLEKYNRSFAKAFIAISSMKYATVPSTVNAKSASAMATYGFKYNKGDCRTQALCLYYVARTIGYKPVYRTGYIPTKVDAKGNPTAFGTHAWITMPKNGIDYVFDPSFGQYLLNRSMDVSKAYRFVYGTKGTYQYYDNNKKKIKGPIAPEPVALGWEASSKGVYTYTLVNGRLAAGRTKIGNYYYFFDAQGRQRVGWQRSQGDFYFFCIDKGVKGYMKANTTVNGIKLDATGKAIIPNNTANRKLELMLKANRTLESLCNYSLTYSKEQKLRMCFDYTLRTYYCTNIGDFRMTSTWDMDYAERVIIPTSPTYRADCFTYGCGYAYLANACGAKAASVSSGGHGWAEVDGMVCDPDWALVDKSHSYFMRDYYAGSGGIVPNYKNNRAYVKEV